MRRLEFVQIVPSTMPIVWDFFSSPDNLSSITPPSMAFLITSPKKQIMYEGMFITYIVKPLLGIPVSWVTEITKVEKFDYFIDEQRLGPYKIWHHEHHFKQSDNGIEIRDVLHYHIAGGFIGKLIDMLIVKSKILSIFEFRNKKIEELFPSSKQ